LIEAGEKGSVDAQVVLGKCFYQGKWVPKDLMLAKFWLQKACEKNNPEAVKLYDEVIRVKDIIL
jgi:TPR repeat protein